MRTSVGSVPVNRLVGFLFAAACAGLVLVGAAGLAVQTGVFGGKSKPTAAASPGPGAPAPSRIDGCRLILSSTGGYPDSYFKRALTPNRHPPLPVSGWHSRAIPFDTVFHSFFHGYLVVSYRPELGDAGREELRSWVQSHRGERVVATLDRDTRAPLVSVAAWGWEAQCNRAPSTRALDRLAARRHA
jgi:hypothetical protein